MLKDRIYFLVKLNNLKSDLISISNDFEFLKESKKCLDWFNNDIFLDMHSHFCCSIVDIDEFLLNVLTCD